MYEITSFASEEQSSYSIVEEHTNDKRVEGILANLREQLLFNKPTALDLFHQARSLVHKAAHKELNSVEKKATALFYMKKLLEQEVGYNFLTPKFSEDFPIFLKLTKKAVERGILSQKAVDEMFYSIICHGYLREPAFNEKLISYISDGDVCLLSRMEALNSSLLKQPTEKSLATFDDIAKDVQGTKDPAVYLRFYELSKTMSSHRPMNHQQILGYTKALARALSGESRITAFKAILDVEMRDHLPSATQTNVELKSYKLLK